MAKHLKVILEDKRLEGVKKSTVEPGSTGVEPGVDYKPKAPDDQEFVSIHKTEKHASRAGNGPDVFAGAKQKPSLSDPKNKHLGYKDLKDAMKVNEAAACNESPAGTKCPMHGLDDCSGTTGKSKNLLLDKKVDEEVSVDESIADRKAHSDRMHLIHKTGKTETGMVANKTLRDKAHAFVAQRQKMIKTTAKEDVQIDEVLTSKDPASKWIHDFVHSDNPKFAGKSKKERQKQALAAYYSKKRSVKEDAAEPMLEGGKKKKIKKEDGQIMPAKTDSGVADDAGRVL